MQGSTDSTPRPSEGTRLLELGELARARQWFERIATSPDVAADPQLRAEVAIGLSGLWIHQARTSLDRARVATLQQAALSELDPGSRAAWRLRIRIAAERDYVAGDRGQVVDLLADARRLGDPLVQAEALAAAIACLSGPAQNAAALELADELITVSPAARPIDGLLGLTWRAVLLLRAGDRRAPRASRELRQALAESPCPAIGYLADAIDVMRLIGGGRLDEAEESAARCHALGTEVGDPDADAFYYSQLVALRWLQGRTAELAALVDELVDSTIVAEPAAGFLAVVAAFGSDAGAAGVARSALAALRAGGLRNLPVGTTWLATLLAAARAAHRLDDRATAAEAYELLLPHADLPVIVSMGVACFGSVHYGLGVAAATLGELDRAVDHLQAAADAEERWGWRGWRIRTLDTMCDVLRTRGAPSDLDRADAVTATLRHDVDELGLTAWGGGTPERPAPIELRRSGTHWVIGYAGRSALLADSVGAGYLASLIDNPGVEISALELAGGRAAFGLDAPDQDLLDAPARAAYRRRVADLESEIADAVDSADDVRADAARRELTELRSALAEATGLAGRGRAFTGSAERARVSVQKAIHRALDALIADDAVIGAALSSRISTGTRCRYTLD